MTNRNFRGFVSYSWSADSSIAPYLHALIPAIPGTSRRKLFLDKKQFSIQFRKKIKKQVVSDEAIKIKLIQAMESSDFFILLASPLAAKSNWVDFEIRTWLSQNSYRTLLLLLTGGCIAWDKEKNDFDWKSTDALPKTLKGVFSDEPIFFDLNEYKKQKHRLRHLSQDLSFMNVLFRLTAALDNRSPNEIKNKWIKQSRRNTQILVVLLFLSGFTILLCGIWIEVGIKIPTLFLVSCGLTIILSALIYARKVL